MFNATGLLVRFSLPENIKWLFFAAGLVVLSILFRKATSLPRLSVGLIIAVFCSPHLHFQDISLLSIPIALISLLAIMLASLEILLAYGLNIQHLGVYLLMAFLIWYWSKHEVQIS